MRIEAEAYKKFSSHRAMIAIYRNAFGFEKTRCRFRCLFTNITQDNDELDLFALLVNSVNIWKEENIAQIELKHLSDWDYSKFFNYFKMTRIYRNPDLILSYYSSYH